MLYRYSYATNNEDQPREIKWLESMEIEDRQPWSLDDALSHPSIYHYGDEYSLGLWKRSRYRAGPI